MGCWPSSFSDKTNGDCLLCSTAQHMNLTSSHVEAWQTFPKSSWLPQMTHSPASIYTTLSLDSNSPAKLLAHCSQCLYVKMTEIPLGEIILLFHVIWIAKGELTIVGLSLLHSSLRLYFLQSTDLLFSTSLHVGKGHQLSQVSMGKANTHPDL